MIEIKHLIFKRLVEDIWGFVNYIVERQPKDLSHFMM